MRTTGDWQTIKPHRPDAKIERAVFRCRANEKLSLQTKARQAGFPDLSSWIRWKLGLPKM